MTSTLSTLLARVADIDTRPPRVEAIDAIRTIEQTLVEALRGETLRGLPNLGTGTTPFHGANVRAGAYDTKVSFPRDGQDMGTPTLIIRSDGRLAVAWTLRQASPRGVVPLFEFTYRGAEDDDLRVEDLGALLTVLPKVLTDHLAKVEKTQSTYEAVKDLAHRVLDLVPRR